MKKHTSNLELLNPSHIREYKNDTDDFKKTKNLLVKTDKKLLNTFLDILNDFYIKNDSRHLRSYRHFIVVILLNMETDFKNRYGQLKDLSQNDFLFYKKRGKKGIKREDDFKQGTINFILNKKYAYLYFLIMHNYYINEIKSTYYSISQFFTEIVEYIKENELKMKEIIF